VSNIFKFTSTVNSLFLLKYNLLQGVVGQGSYGIVKLAYNQEDDKNYAMKILRCTVTKYLTENEAFQSTIEKWRYPQEFNF
jgi:serine/threonine protein kinase